MRRIFVVGFLVLLPIEMGQARIGETIEQLTKRYGDASLLNDEEGGLTVVKYEKDGLVFTFSLLNQVAEALEIDGRISDSDAEVFIAKNCPNEKFTLSADSTSGYEFFKAFHFKNGTTAYFYQLDGHDNHSILRIKTKGMQEFEKMREEAIKKQGNQESNKKYQNL